MLQSSRQPDLALKAFRPEGDRKLGMEDLEGDRAVVSQIVG
jgi:hypothetical protein